ncbi:uncharacterized protein [Rutidosis leptorrhynchoides]|uniref:uncharacterized protein n=1 Tax=Rutidosis leptorrhynchoides TaxID=125765 RepID=UPI003A9979C4
MTIWWQWVNIVKLKGNFFWDIGQESNDSWGWRKLLALRDKMKLHMSIDQNGECWWISRNKGTKKFTVSQAWKDLECGGIKVDWYKAIWHPQIIPKHAFISWLAFQGRLNTQDRLMKRYPNEEFICSFCGKQEDSHSHLFFRCEITNQIWLYIRERLFYKGLHYDLKNIINDIVKYPAVRDIRNILNKIVVGAAVYFIGMGRNRRHFLKQKKSVEVICKELMLCIQGKLMSISVKDTKNVHKVACMWGMVVRGNKLLMY